MPPKGSETAILPKYVIRGEDGRVKCLACGSDWMKRNSLAKHLKSTSHEDSLPVYEANSVSAAAESIRQTNTLNLNPLPSVPPDHNNIPSQSSIWVSGDLQHLDVNGIDTNDYLGVNFSLGTIDNGIRHLDWSRLGTSFSNGIRELDLEQEVEDDEFAMPLPQRVLQDLNEEDPDIESLQERFAELKAKSSFSPYTNKTMFLLDMLDNIPRLRLSTGHLKLIMWVMEEAGCHDMPKFYELRQTQKRLKEFCGIEAHHYRSSRGNSFHMLDIPQLIGRDLSNPIVAPHLVFYPEDSGDSLAESWQANKWKEKIPLEQLTPMYADGGKLFYVNELARLHNGRFVIPQRWITRNGVLTADCWPVSWRSIPQNELDSGLHVSQDIIHVPSSAFASNYYDIMEHMDPISYCFTDDSKSFQDKMPNPLRNLTDGSEELLSCFIKPWCDDVSGGRSKQYQPHNNIYLSHANLPGHLHNQEYFVRFVSTTTHASSVEQFEAVKQQLDANNQSPIRVYNAVTGRFVRLRIYILNLPADNRAQSEVASHVCGGNRLCRKCDAGGPYRIVETEEGYKVLFQPANARTQADTVQTIWDQITIACLGVEDRVTEMFTESGIKDPTAQDLIIQLIERGRNLRKQLKVPKEGVDDAALIKLQSEWLKSQPALPFNILFQIHGLDPHRDTPVEILHTILLGVEKYAWYLVHSSTRPDAQKKFETRLQSSSILGLEVDPIRASYIMNYKNNLIGRQLKMLMQLTVFHVHDLVSQDSFSVIKAVGELGAVLWYSKIDNLEDYLAPSQDIARKMIELERFRHIACGGYWVTETGIERASENVRRYFETNLQLQTHLGWVKPETVKPGTIRLQNQKQQRTYQWQDTIGGKAGIRNQFWEERSWYEGKSSIAVSGDKCEVGAWVVATQNGSTIIGRVEQILMDSKSGYHGVAILNTFDLAEHRHPILNMPVLVQTQNDKCYITVVSAYNIEFCMNVQHDCITLSCPNSGVENVRQERLNTTIQRQTVEHRDKAIFVINMHALHNAQRTRQILPRSLTKPIPLHLPQAREAFLSGVATRLHTQQTARREELSKKRKAAREAREKEDLAAGPST
ncbi:unnamed protein product [Rhizoctonia solani]|uniref:C2H2-type domain-containing protein n=1 Tax=Rhizoctonia solani TaxID=456999 RepID=A0A8H3DAD6_9AGAM|nr:unnamed protein product [Rhizoctonia solani]